MAETRTRPANRQKERRRAERLEIVASLYRRGYTFRAIREEVMRSLGLATYSLRTVQRDVDILLSEWRERRLAETDALVSLELSRIDEACRELWEQWEKSKTDYDKKRMRQKGAPLRKGGGSGDTDGVVLMRTYEQEQGTEHVVRLGDPAYLAEIRKQLEERRKLLGLYAPERKDVTSGGMSFASFLVESGMLEEAEAGG